MQSTEKHCTAATFKTKTDPIHIKIQVREMITFNDREEVFFLVY